MGESSARQALGDDRFRILRSDGSASGPVSRRHQGVIRMAVVAIALVMGVVVGRRSMLTDDLVVAADVAADVAAGSVESDSLRAGPVASVPALETVATELDATAEPEERLTVEETPSTAGLRFAVPARLRDVDGLLRPAAPGVPVCALGARVHDDPEIRRALGPCFGPLTADGSAVAGSHRVEGTACCSHHAFVERVSSGVTNPARMAALLAAAAQAERDGLVPPLLVIRAERSAARFLRAGTGTWSAAGLDGDQEIATEGVSHAWALREGPRKGPGEADAIRLELTSWVRIAPDDAPRSFRLVLDVTGAAPGDVLRSFDWLGQ